MTRNNKTALLTSNKKLKNKKVCFRRKRVNNYNRPLKLNLVRYLQSELQSSTTHGLPYVVNNHLYYSEKAFWMTCIISCIIIMISLLTLQYLRFVATPAVMSVERNYFDWNISYPSIALCPLYKVDIIKFGKFVNDTYNTTGLDIKGYLWTITQAGLDNLEFLEYNFPNEVLQLIEPRNYAKLAATFFRDFEKCLLTSNDNRSISVDAVMTEIGMCHIINSNVAKFHKPLDWSADDIITVSHAIRNIELSIYEADFYTMISDYASVYEVYIHGPNEVTLATGSSFIFDVEGLISFGLSVWSTRISDELRYKSIGIRKCRFNDEPISKRYPVYSFTHCMLECRIKMILRLCGCVPHFFKPLDSERVCHIKELKCVLEHRKEIVTLETLQETYNSFCNTKALPKMSRDCGCLDSCELDLYYKDNEDFLPIPGMNKLKIKITSFPKFRVVRDVIFSFYDILLKSGGVMNLCIGSSLISLAEFILVTLKCIFFIVCKALDSICQLQGNGVM